MKLPRRLLLLLLFALNLFLLGNSFPLIYAQSGTVGFGGWRAYVSHRQGKSLTLRGNQVLMASTVGLVFYDAQTQVYKEITRAEGLSGSAPQTVYYGKEADLFFVAYENGLMDYFRSPDENIRTYRDIFLTRNFSSKRINHLFSFGRFLYISTDFGIVVRDNDRNETRFTYTNIGDNPPESPVFASAIFGGRLYALMGDRGLYSASLSSPNLADGSVWRRESGTRNLPFQADSRLMAANEKLLAVQIGTDVFILNQADGNWFRPEGEIYSSADRWTDFRASERGLVLSASNLAAILYNDLRTEVPPSVENQVSAGLGSDERMWAAASSRTGLTVFNKNTRDTLLKVIGGIPNNLCSDMGVENGQLYVGPGAENNGAPSFDKSGIYYLRLSDRKWKVLNGDNGGLDPRGCFQSNGYLFYDRTTDRAYVASWDCGINVLEQGKRIATLDRTNTCLTGVGGNDPQDFIRPRGIGKDSKGNLWVVTNAAVRPIAVITPENECYSYPPVPRAGNQLWRMTLDQNDNLWMVNRREGAVVYSQRGTLDNPDFTARLLRAAAGQGNLPSDEVNAFAQDPDGVMWLGTGAGVCAFYNPSAVLNAETIPDAVKPIYEGSFLLKDERITDIAIDGAGRKWFGTNDNGVFLFNREVTAQLAHFTSRNSPLLSDRIYDIEIDETGGEVFFATQEGIVSYQDVVTGGKETNDSLIVFPSPYYSDRSVPMVIRGTVDGASVKITSLSGLLVKELTAQGGQALWDGKDILNRTVRSGVYLIFVATDEGKSPNVTKVTVLSRDE